MRKSKKITVAGKEITAQELTPRQVDTLLGKSAKELKAESLATLMGSELTTDAVLMATGIKDQELLDDFTLEELAEIWAAAEEVNGFLLERLDKALKKAMETIERTNSAG